MVTTTAGEVVVTGEVAARPAVASMVMANEATAMADEVRAVGTAAAALATVPVSIHSGGEAAVARAAVATLAAMLAVARAAMAMVEKTRACGMAAVGLEVWRRLRRGGVRLVAAYSRALLAVKRELRNGAELSGMRVIVRSFLQFCNVQATFFFARPPTKRIQPSRAPAAAKMCRA